MKLKFASVVIVLSLALDVTTGGVTSRIEQDTAQLPQAAISAAGQSQHWEHNQLLQEREKRSREGSLITHSHNVAYHLLVVGAMVLLVLPVTITGILCCKKNGAAGGKRAKKQPLEEPLPFDSKTNPMNAHGDYFKEYEIDRKGSCSKMDSLYRSNSFHPLGSPTFSTFGSFGITEQEPLGMPRRVKMSAIKERITKSASEPNLLDDFPADLPNSFITPQPSHVSQLLKESVTSAVMGSTGSLVPGPSLTHHTPPPPSQPTPPNPNLKPVYIVPPEVEKVEVHTSHSPQTRKPPPVPGERLNSATSVSSLGSTSSWQHQSLSMLSENSDQSESDQPSPIFKAFSRFTECSPRHQSRDSVFSLDTPQHRKDSRPMSSVPGEARETKPSPLHKIPSPIHIRSDTLKECKSGMKQRALPPTPHQLHRPLNRATGTLPIKRYRSPLLSTDLIGESSLDLRVQGPRSVSPISTHTLQEPGTSLTLPSRSRKIVFKSRTQSDIQPARPVTMAMLAPPRPPRKLIDPTRQIDFSHLISGVQGSSVGSVESGVRESVRSEARDSMTSEASIRSEGADSEGVEDQAVCIHCGRHIQAEPFYICVADSEDGSTQDSVSNTPELTDTSSHPKGVETTSGPAVEVSSGCSHGGDLESVTDTMSEITPATCSIIDSETPKILEPQSEAAQTTTAVSIEAQDLQHKAGTDSREDASLDTTEPSGPVPESEIISVSAVESSVPETGSELPEEEVRSKPTSKPPTGNIGRSGSLEEQLEPGSVICMDCVKREGPIYHELEPAEIEAILLGRDPSAPPLPPREHPPQRRDPVYERIGSVKRKLTFKLSTGSRIVTRVSLDGAYIIEASKPRRPRYQKNSTDYEQVSTDLETPTSPHYHRASEVHQLGGNSSLTDADAANHTRCKPHPPLVSLRANKSGSHEYESLPGSFEGHRTNLRATRNRRGSHDYAFIGPAPSLESLDERCSSPPYVPPGAHRATRMRIDSQGYASVIPDFSDVDPDCLESGESFHGSMESLDPLRDPNDYEVPVIAMLSETNQTGKPSPSRLARQRAVSEHETTVEKLDNHQETAAKVTDTQTVASVSSVWVAAVTQSMASGGSIDSVTGADMNEDVFDSGFENSNEGFEIKPLKSAKVIPPVPPRPPRSLSVPEVRQDMNEELRSRSMTVNSSKPTPLPRKKISILLNNQSSIVV